VVVFAAQAEHADGVAEVASREIPRPAEGDRVDFSRCDLARMAREFGRKQQSRYDHCYHEGNSAKNAFSGVSILRIAPFVRTTHLRMLRRQIRYRRQRPLWLPWSFPHTIAPKVIRLAETLAEPESKGERREDIRSLVGEVVITPGDKGGESYAILRGELMTIPDLAAGRRRSPKPEVITNAPAGPRFESTIHQVSEFRRTIGGNIADLRPPSVRFYPITLSRHPGIPTRENSINVNMSECALNQNSLQLTLNHRVPGSSPAAPTTRK
jgi:hypothetical protein